MIHSVDFYVLLILFAFLIILTLLLWFINLSILFYTYKYYQYVPYLLLSNIIWKYGEFFFVIMFCVFMPLFAFNLHSLWLLILLLNKKTQFFNTVWYFLSAKFYQLIFHVYCCTLLRHWLRYENNTLRNMYYVF